MDEIEVDPTAARRPLRLWSPWRMQYVGGGAREEGCIFCNRLAGTNDSDSLILHRGRDSFTIMNLFPYNTGHVMQVPNRHAPSPEDAPAEALIEIAATLPTLIRALRRVLDCQGFNVGLNIGAIAGAGVAEHLHQHVVPRWQGDANFMPILGGAMVMPELIPVTYAKIRAELTRETSRAVPGITLVILDRGRESVVLDGSGRLPRVEPGPSTSTWRAAIDHAAALGFRAAVERWCGPDRVEETGVCLALVAEASDERASWTPVENAQTSVPASERAFLRRACKT